jgi:hypothetical protein
LVHRFWTIWGGILAGFIALEQVLQGFDSRDSVQTEFLKVPSQRIHQAALIAVELRESAGVLSHFLIVGDYAVFYDLPPLKYKSHLHSKQTGISTHKRFLCRLPRMDFI